METQAEPKVQKTPVASMVQTVKATQQHIHLALIGRNGFGKTSLLWTLPGRKLIFAFDPNSASSLAGCPDATVIDLQPGLDEMDDQPTSIRQRVKSVDQTKPKLYSEYGKILKAMVEEVEVPAVTGLPSGVKINLPPRRVGCIPGFDWICVDGLTYLGRAMHNVTMVEQDKINAQDQRTDHAMTGRKLASHLQKLIALRNNLCVTAHYRGHMSEDTGQLRFHEVEGFGGARALFPTMFEEIYSCLCSRPKDASKPTTFSVLTQPTERYAICRTTKKENVQPQIDVTIRDWSNPTLSGLGPAIRELQAQRTP